MDRHADIYRFVQQLIALRMNRDLPAERLDLTSRNLFASSRPSGTASD
jgi:hypothetical protein